MVKKNLGRGREGSKQGVLWLFFTVKVKATIDHLVTWLKTINNSARTSRMLINIHKWVVQTSSLCVHNSVGCLWHSHGKNPARLYPKLQSQPIGLPKIFIDYLFFQADQSDCTKSVSIFNRFASSEELWIAKFVALEFSHSWFRMAC